MGIKFKVIFNDGRITFVEYLFPSWRTFNFDLLHYNQDDVRIDSKTVCNFSVRKAIRNLVTRAKQNNATIKIVERDGNSTKIQSI
jgi:hypothetical protein